jgi:hypothetical protein
MGKHRGSVNITDPERLYGTLESVTAGVQHVFSILDTTASLAISTCTMPVPGRGFIFLKKVFLRSELIYPPAFVRCFKICPLFFFFLVKHSSCFIHWPVLHKNKL